MKDIVQFTIATRLTSEANNYDHWTKKNKRKLKNKFLIKAALNTVLEKENIILPCRIQLIRVAPRKLDYDNLVYAFKGIRDSIADEIIKGKAPGQADGSSQILWEYNQEKGEPKNYAIRVEIRPINNYFPS